LQSLERVEPFNELGQTSTAVIQVRVVFDDEKRFAKK
jgi:hypothetical protein